MEKLLDKKSKKELEKEVLELRRKIETMETCRETAQKLKKSEERFRILFEYAPDGYFICDMKGTFIDANIAAENIIGYNKEELIGTNFLQQGILEAKYLPRAVKNLSKNLMGRSTGPNEFLLNRKDGSSIWTEITTHPIKLDGKRVVLGIARDISRRREAEQALRENEETMRAMFENAPDAIFVADPKTGKLTGCNKHALEMTGYSKEEILRMKAEQLHPEDKVEQTMKDFKKHARGEILVVESEVLTKDERRIPVSINSSIITSRGKKFVQGNFRDITEKRIVEEKLLRDQKLDSLGTLAGGIAHDFNNILMGIAGNIGLARLKIDGNNEAYDHLSIAEKAAIRGKVLTQQLLTFSSGGAPAKKTVSVANEVKKAARFALSGSFVEAEFSFEDEGWKADVDTGQFNQALCNIFINAREAMKKEGTVYVGIEKIEVREDSSAMFLPGNYIQISIKDQGGGIPENVISRIFDPFFSTKEKNKGMGLAVTYSIIKRHSGYLLADSTPGEGAAFYIMLPVSEKSIYTTKCYAADTRQRTGKILVMDDEEAITTVAAHILSEIGYTADTAADGQEAIDKYKKAQESGNPFDAVIMDLTVPGGMGGEKAVKKLLSIDSGAKVIVSSGYSNSPVFADYARHGFKASMPKPYDIEELKHILRKVMDE